MDIDRLEIIPPDPDAHADALLGLLNLEWTDIEPVLRAGRISHSHYDWATSRIGLFGDRLVTHFGVYDISMRIGVARARAAGVNLVATHPDERGRGLMTRTGRAAVAAMRAQGYDLSVVCNGTERYYDRFGYVLGWPEQDFVVQTPDLPDEPLDFEPLSCPTEQRLDFTALYNRENATVTGTAVRPTYPHGKHPGNGRGLYWTDERGVTAGYMFFDVHEPSSTLWHDDSAGDVEQRLRLLGALARQLGCAQIRCERLGYRSALGRRLRQLNCRAESKYVQGGGWMIQILNLTSLLEHIVPELERRLAGSWLAGWRGDLLLIGDDQQATLAIDGGRVRVQPPRESSHVLRAGPALAQLVVGTDAPDELVATASIGLEGDAGLLLLALFPAQNPQMSNDDL
jgi:predicted N-acetyltransferase YhbS